MSRLHSVLGHMDTSTITCTMCEAMEIFFIGAKKKKIIKDINEMLFFLSGTGQKQSVLEISFKQVCKILTKLFTLVEP